MTNDQLKMTQDRSNQFSSTWIANPHQSRTKKIIAISI